MNRIEYNQVEKIRITLRNIPRINYINRYIKNSVEIFLNEEQGE